jgi:hypothetical protein
MDTSEIVDGILGGRRTREVENGERALVQLGDLPELR